MSPEKQLAIVVGVVWLIFVGVVVFIKAPKRLKRDKFKQKWSMLQERCPDKSQWAIAIQEADDLLDEALKKKRIKGKTMGERLVAAQKKFTDNDAVWYGHKLRTKLDIDPELPLKKQQVQKALFGLRQGLKDVGAL
jgi:hypothetical protein